MTVLTTEAKTSTDLDLASVLKASQALSSEIMLNTLLEKIMKIVLENAGAEKGYLILRSQAEPGNKHEQWVIKASGTIDNNRFKVLPSIPIKTVNSSSDMSMISLGIVNYVSRTQESIILNDALHEGNFTCDPYIVKQQTKSVLCAPLLNQGKLAGLLYLENNQMSGAFTPKHLEVLKLLTKQVVISIENAELYTNLQAHSQELKVKNRKLLEANRQLKVEITERRRAESQLRHNALHDTLTELPNRALFMERLTHAVEYTKRDRNSLFAVLFLDLNQFKVINDSLGHIFGDRLLIAIARRLQACLRPTDILARLGGDEFTILLEGLSHSSDTIRVAERIQAQLTKPFKLGEHEVFIATSIGIVLSTGDYSQPEDLLRDADVAMYRAKNLNSRYEIFNPSMHERAISRLQKETELRRAIERQEFLVYFQPLVSLATGRVIGFEALVRWQHPERGLLSPVDFVLMAEEIGLLGRIDQWVMGEACRQTQQWLEQIPDDLPLSISVNLANQQFTRANLSEQISQTLQETGLDPSRLKLEITENVIMGNDELAIIQLEKLKALGIGLAIDDFGTGYSSLGRLHRFPIDELKIDRSFISQIGVQVGNLEITETLLTLAQKLNLAVTAEGIETAEQLSKLRALNCTYGQGYFFARPLSTQDAEVLIRAKPQW